ncbi:MAG: PmoA family protein [Chthoniobacteraceae bacterium]
MLRPILPVLCALPVLLAAARADVTFEEKPDRVSVKINGSLFTEYRHGDSSHIYYYPLIGPDGAKMTRSFPMEKVEGESTDHPHHRSMWFSHGFVNGVDFWSEAATFGAKPPKNPIGKTEHVKVLAMEPGAKVGVLKTAQNWTMPDGSSALTSVQTLRIHAGPETERMLDFEVTLKAGDKDAIFGETKEGSAALRIADSMRVKQGKSPGVGHILNSEGLKDTAVWGQHSKWVTMAGPIDGKSYAITFMDHPSNPRNPTRWHARDYGLFAANPFCEYDMDKTQPKGSGDYTLKAGQSITLKYRILITQGDENAAKQNERYAEFAK